MTDFKIVEDETHPGQFIYDGFVETFHPRVEEIAEATGLQSVMLIRSTLTHTGIVCTG